MSKVITDEECADIVHKIIHEDLIECQDSYMYFLEDLGKLIANHLGGEFIGASPPGSKNTRKNEQFMYALHFEHNECIPKNGGVYKNYDTDVSIEEWKKDSDRS